MFHRPITSVSFEKKTNSENLCEFLHHLHASGEFALFEWIKANFVARLLEQCYIEQGGTRETSKHAWRKCVYTDLYFYISIVDIFTNN